MDNEILQEIIRHAKAQIELAKALIEMNNAAEKLMHDVIRQEGEL